MSYRSKIDDPGKNALERVEESDAGLRVAGFRPQRNEEQKKDKKGVN